MQACQDYANQERLDLGVLIEAVYIELKGGWKWEDSVIKFKAFRKAMAWAQFQFHQKQEGRWEQLA